MKVAIVHEWFVSYAGSEKVVQQLLEIFPEADLFALVDFLPEDKRGFIQNKKVTTSFIQKLPFAKTKYRSYLPLMPLAIEQLDVSKYDVVISSSHAVAKGVITGPNQLHISYVHSPIRYAWDLQHQYLRESGLNKGIKGLIARYFLHKIRIWDYRTANGVDFFIANSQFISKRIWKVYRRKSDVIYPPVNIERFELKTKKGNYYLTASRMVPYKRIDLIVKAFSKLPYKKLYVIGNGPEFNKIQKSSGSNVILLGYQSDEVLTKYMQNAKAFVYAAVEDFGITPVEAQACGTPIIAYGEGGLRETIREMGNENPTGVFYKEQTEESLIEAINIFEDNCSLFNPINCRNNAILFSEKKFRERFRNFIENRLQQK
ncbi:glycosyltransferase family 4 protein [Sporolactobacillus nakayamae]|uniref:Glycosyltransferase involved in cell wall bisynthesis n=1 Tax=Sporolactobacillus nakayamae TaxID=269670 RepID=A0A1I2W004_9BACL|nr:glycosyltransferase family 4 protein [Sporolactobacillus nakayamae]SFG94592.1 Glycosyltransferase involved in cell wall bisynthesis [Sporolactobacillus nakayamae]